MHMSRSRNRRHLQQAPDSTQLLHRESRLSGGHKLTPGFILECGFIGTFVVVTAVVFAVSAVLGKRARRRATRQDGGAPAARRRAAARGWGKA